MSSPGPTREEFDELARKVKALDTLNGNVIEAIIALFGALVEVYVADTSNFGLKTLIEEVSAVNEKLIEEWGHIK